MTSQNAQLRLFCSRPRSFDQWHVSKPGSEAVLGGVAEPPEQVSSGLPKGEAGNGYGSIHLHEEYTGTSRQSYIPGARVAVFVSVGRRGTATRDR